MHLVLVPGIHLLKLYYMVWFLNSKVVALIQVIFVMVMVIMAHNQKTAIRLFAPWNYYPPLESHGFTLTRFKKYILLI